MIVQTNNVNLVYCLMGIVLTLLYGVSVGFSRLEFLAVAVILILLLISSIKKKPINKFEGYVCESCGAEYGCCCHCKDEEYTLVKRH